MGMRAAILWTGFIVVVFTGLGVPNTGHAATSLSIPPTVTSTGHQNDRLVAAGYLDVTLYGADSTGHNDSTTAIQNAINDGIKYSMTVYVPSGTYMVSNTLNGMQDCNDTNNYNFGAISKYGMHKAPSLAGPASGARPTIVLKDGSAGILRSNKSEAPGLFRQYDGKCHDHELRRPVAQQHRRCIRYSFLWRHSGHQFQAG